MRWSPINLALLMFLMLPPIAPRAATLPPTIDADRIVLRTRLEKTWFRVDVLDLELRIAGQSATKIRAWIEDGTLGETLPDSIVSEIVDIRRAEVSQVFLRSVSLGRFLKGIRDNLRHAREAGFISDESETRISDSLSDSYEFLAHDGVAKGDSMAYWVHGDSLRIRYFDNDGTLRLDQTDLGPEHRRALLGSFVAPRSDFRKGLLKSILENQ